MPEPPPAISATEAGAFTALDWTVVAVYLLAMALMGAWFTRKQSSTHDYFLASRSIPVWAAAVSIVATSVSAATFLGAPESAFRGNLTYLSFNLASMISVVIVAIFFIPAFYKHNVTTVYGLLTGRFGPGARLGASGMFMIGRVFASGARLFMASIPFSLIVYGDLEPNHLFLAIAIVTAVSMLYTTLGGLKAVIWTEAPQALIFVGAAVVAIFLLLTRIPLSPGEIIGVLSEAQTPAGTSKLTIFDWRLSAAGPYSMWSALLGVSLFFIAVYGADQDLAQRILSCKSAVRGSWSVILSNIIGLGVAILFLAIGLLLYIFYSRPDIMGDAAPAYTIDDTRAVFLNFILAETPAGVRGVMIAGLFAAAMSSLASSMSAMASTAICDFYRPLRAGKTERHYMAVSRFAVAAWGVVLGAFACVCVWWQQERGQELLEFAIGVMLFAYTGLLGVFLTAIFTKRGNTLSVALALIVGFLAVVAFDILPRRIDSFPKLALGWQMLGGTLISFLVCFAGPRVDPSLQEQTGEPSAPPL